MLNPSKPKRLVAQAPLRLGICAAGCGAQIHYRTSPNIYCEPCRVKGRKENVLRAMERQRRKNGARKVKGTFISCAECGKETPSNSFKRRYCDECGPNLWKINASKSINLRIGNLIRAGLASGSKRRRHWEPLVGFTLTELMRHLERQFLPGMTWANRGDWHIDHVRPLCSFEFTTPECPQFREAWALTNLRPLWAADNIRKSGRRDLLL